MYLYYVTTMYRDWEKHTEAHSVPKRINNYTPNII